MENLQSISTNNHIDITHKYVRTFEDFQQAYEKEYPNQSLKEINSNFISLSIVRNFMSAIEFSKIVSTHICSLLSITKLNL